MMSKELAEEIENRVFCKEEDAGYMEDNGHPSRAQLEIDALNDLVDLGTDCGGEFDTRFILPDFTGDPAWVKEMKEKQAKWLAAFWVQRKAWLKLRNEAKRELKKRTQSAATA